MRPSWCSAGLLNKKLAGAISLAGPARRGHRRLGRRLLSGGADAARGSAKAASDLSATSPRSMWNSCDSLWREGMVPVASCMGLGADGELYNINADHMAAAAAEFIRRRPPDFPHGRGWSAGRRKGAASGPRDRVEDLIRRNKVSGGMILKLEAAKRALAGGVAEVRIVGGTQRARAAFRCGWSSRPGHASAARFLRGAARTAHGAAQ